MTREEAIKIIDCYDIGFYDLSGEKIPADKLAVAFDMAIDALSDDTVKRVDCSNFLLWLLEEIMDEENWELNAVADGEIIARKLKKLGLLEVKDGYYHRIFDENVWVVRCKDCLKTIVRPDGEIYCKEFDREEMPKEFYCGFGERREP